VSAIERPLTANIQPLKPPPDAREYQRGGGYEALRRAMKMSPRDVQQVVIDSLLRGRGGAGFPTGKKWAAVPMGDAALKTKYLVVNADEMEPGTMKDRLLLEGNPHQLIEGAAIASYAIGAGVCYIFLRGEYKLSAQRLRKALAEAYEAGVLGKNVLGVDYRLEMHLHTSAGRYMCGEEEGLLDALEGKRSLPRSKPPYAVVSGLWGRPSVVNNVETLCCVPHIVRHGAEWFRKLSKSGVDGGTKIFGVSGRVKNPGRWELPMGTTPREILYEYAGGMAEGRRFRALLPGGASTGFLTEEHLDLKMDFDDLHKASSHMGTGTMIVLDDGNCPVKMLLSMIRFFARESCGWCTPCREGLPWIRQLLEALESGDGRGEDLEMLRMHVQYIRPGHTFCALAPGAIMPVETALMRFETDFRRHVEEHRCPWR
jgi:NADH-quinone oxidoreductase subunit F